MDFSWGFSTRLPRRPRGPCVKTRICRVRGYTREHAVRRSPETQLKQTTGQGGK